VSCLVGLGRFIWKISLVSFFLAVDDKFVSFVLQGTETTEKRTRRKPPNHFSVENYKTISDILSNIVSVGHDSHKRSCKRTIDRHSLTFQPTFNPLFKIVILCILFKDQILCMKEEISDLITLYIHAHPGQGARKLQALISGVFVPPCTTKKFR